MAFLYNTSSTKDLRRNLRKNQTDAEKKLWSILRNKQLEGLKFFRQYSAGSYILDFFCPTKRLAIELDGGQHNEKINQEHDTKRTKYLSEQHIAVLRFWNDEVLNNLEGVYLKIQEKIKSNSS